MARRAPSHASDALRAAPLLRGIAAVAAFATALASGAGAGAQAAAPLATSAPATTPEPVVGRWELTGAMNVPRSSHSLTVLADGRVLAAGGCTGAYVTFEPDLSCGRTDLAELYDPATGRWTLTGTMNEPRAFHAAVLLRDGRVLVAGGWSPWSMSPTAAVWSSELYDPSTGRWAQSGAMTQGRAAASHDLSLVVLPSGKVLFPGGVDRSGLAFAASADLYDPASGSWTPTGPMVVPRSNPTVVLLPSGQVLAVGGLAAWGEQVGFFVDPLYSLGLPGTATAELYDPVHDTWAPTGPLGRPVQWNTLTLLPAGEVLLTGGQVRFGADWLGHNASDQAALYDPATGTWRAADPMLHRRAYSQAVRLPSGRVLVAGGNWTIDGGSRGDLYPAFQPEVFDPGRGAWSRTPVLRHYLLGFGAATLLPTGEVLYTGGLIDDLSAFEFVEGWWAFAISAAQVFHEGSPGGGP